MTKEIDKQKAPPPAPLRSAQASRPGGVTIIGAKPPVEKGENNAGK